jgi:hypothetical protein
VFGPPVARYRDSFKNLRFPVEWNSWYPDTVLHVMRSTVLAFILTTFTLGLAAQAQPALDKASKKGLETATFGLG